MVAEEGLPALGRRSSSPGHILSDAGLADLDAELAQLAMDPRRSPQRVGDAFIVGCIADYLSLGKTRAVLTNIHGIARNWSKVAIVVVDALATVLIYMVVLALSVFVVGWLRSPATSLSEALGWAVRLIMTPQDEQYHLVHPFRALLLVALLTSAWLWVYLIAAEGIRSVGLAQTYLKPISKILDFDNHPVRTIGYAAATVSALVVAIVSIV